MLINIIKTDFNVNASDLEKKVIDKNTNIEINTNTHNEWKKEIKINHRYCKMRIMHLYVNILTSGVSGTVEYTKDTNATKIQITGKYR